MPFTPPSRSVPLLQNSLFSCINVFVIGGIDYQNNCLCSVSDLFWTQYSRVFAEAAQGNVFYLANASTPGGFFVNGSRFGQLELPYINNDSVTRLIAMVIHRKGSSGR